MGNDEGANTNLGPASNGRGLGLQLGEGKTQPTGDEEVLMAHYTIMGDNTVKGRILWHLDEEGPLTYNQLAYRTGDHEPSIRRAAMQLVRERRVIRTRYEPEVEIALSRGY